MSMIENSGRPCPRCREGRLRPVTRVREFAPRGKRVEVILQTSECEACGHEITTAAQHRANLEALAGRKSRYGGLLLGEEILSLRTRYGLTQQAAAKVFGKGKIAFSRYENERTYPDESTTLLLSGASESPAFMKWLADRAKVTLPLWKERCEDEQRVKVRPIWVVHRQDPPLKTGVKSQVLPGVEAVPPGSLARAMSVHRDKTARSVMVGQASNDGDLLSEAVAS